MNIIIKGVRRNRKLNAKAFKEAVVWIKDYVFSGSYDGTITILIGEFLPSTWEGSCTPNDKIFLIKIQPRFSFKKTLKILIHELIHVRQYVTGEMKYVDDDNRLFRGHLYSTRMKYDAYPWEIEPWLMEDIIYKLYEDHCNAVYNSERAEET